MLGRLVDSVVSAVSPAAGVRRLHARNVQRQMMERGYDAAKRGRLNGDWKAANASADLELLGSADVIRARARDLVRNNSYARGIVRAKVRNIIGTGIAPQADIPATDDGESVNEKFENLFDRWQRQADVAQRLTFYDIERLCIAEMVEAGEVLIRFVDLPEDSRRVLPFALEVIEADRLASNSMFPRGRNTDTGNEVRRGVEIDANGEAVAYWLYDANLNSISARSVTPKRYPASEFVHLFKPDRAGQTRGVSEFAPSVLWMKSLERYLSNELEAQAVASCFSVAIKSASGGAAIGLGGATCSDTTDSKGNAFEFLEPGMVARLFPDESIDVINPSRGQAEASPWIMLMLRSLAVGSGLSYERLTRDYSQTNYSSNRAGDLEDRREFRIDQQFMIDKLLIPVWVRFVTSAVASGRFDWLPDVLTYIADFETWTAHHWQPQGWEWVDPAKEVSAITTALDANLTTLQDEVAKRDGDWRRVIQQRQKELALLSSGQAEKGAGDASSN